PAFVGGTLKVRWTGPNGSDVLEKSVTSTGVLRVPVPRAALIDANLNQSVDVWYELVPATGPSGRSQHVLLSVINSASQPWPMPEVWDFSNAPVNPFIPIKPGTQEANTA
ncbi:hypothetical protein, partial [Pseudomonas baltica]